MTEEVKNVVTKERVLWTLNSFEPYRTVKSDDIIPISGDMFGWCLYQRLQLLVTQHQQTVYLLVSRRLY